MAKVTAETAQRRLPIQADAVEGPPETPLAMNGKNYERVLGIMLKHTAARIEIPVEELSKVVEYTAKFAAQERGRKAGTKFAPVLFGPPAISLEHAWRSDSPLFQYANIYRMTNVIKQRHIYVKGELERIHQGRRAFLTDGNRRTAIERETAERDFVGQYLPALEAGLANLAIESWGENAPLYTEVLQLVAEKTASDFTKALTGRKRGLGLSRDEILAAIRDDKMLEAQGKLHLLFGDN